jgi:hypothetical protein
MNVNLIYILVVLALALALGYGVGVDRGVKSAFAFVIEVLASLSEEEEG